MMIFHFFQYFVFDFHMAPIMLFDKIITLTVSKICWLCFLIGKLIQKVRLEDQGSISSMIYEKLLCSKIPKEQKDTDDLTVFLCFWDLRM